jgi:hypothetical protein
MAGMALAFACSGEIDTASGEEPESADPAEARADELARKRFDPAATAKGWITGIAYARGLQSLDARAYRFYAGATPEEKKAVTTLLVKYLTSREPTPVMDDVINNFANWNVQAVLGEKSSSRTKHDLDRLGGRAAWFLEAIHGVDLPTAPLAARTHEELLQVRDLAYEKIIGSMLVSELDVASQLNEQRRIALAEGRHTPDFVFEEFAADPSANVLIALAPNPALPSTVYRLLWKRVDAEGDPDARKAIREGLLRARTGTRGPIGRDREHVGERKIPGPEDAGPLEISPGYAARLATENADLTEQQREILSRLENTQISIADEARRTALGATAARQGDPIVSLVRLGRDVDGFAEKGDLVWIVRFIASLEGGAIGGVTDEIWISASSGAVRSVLDGGGG